MAASFTLPTVLANLAAGNQPLSLIDGDLDALANPLLALITFSNGYDDTGAANAYVITVSSPQTVAYAKYLTVTVIPANTNTAASTLAINALGPKNIFSRGAALVGGEIIAGVPAVFVYDNTQWNLINPQRANGQFTGTITGCTTAPTVTVNYQRADGWLKLDVPAFSALTSNATTKTLTGMPAGIRPAAVKRIATQNQDNGVFAVSNNNINTSGVIDYGYGVNSLAYTASGTFASYAFCITYSLA